MQHIRQTRSLPFSAEQLYHLVSDIERYPEFLPWCQQVKILRRKDTAANAVVDARVAVGFKGMHYRYHCRVRWRPEDYKIDVDYLSGPLSNMVTIWQFTPKTDTDCIVDFNMNLRFRRHLLGSIFETLQVRAIETMTEAFVKRAEGLYGNMQ